jgi:hypothetical protein
VRVSRFRGERPASILVLVDLFCFFFFVVVLIPVISGGKIRLIFFGLSCSPLRGLRVSQSCLFGPLEATAWGPQSSGDKPSPASST